MKHISRCLWNVNIADVPNSSRFGAAKWWKPRTLVRGEPAIEKRAFSAGDSLRQLPSGFLPFFGQLSSPLFGMDKHVIRVSKFFFPRLPDFAITAPVFKLGAVQQLQ